MINPSGITHWIREGSLFISDCVRSKGLMFVPRLLSFRSMYSSETLKSSSIESITSDLPTASNFSATIRISILLLSPASSHIALPKATTEMRSSCRIFSNSCAIRLA